MTSKRLGSRRQGRAGALVAVLAMVAALLTGFAAPASAASPEYIQIPGSPFSAGPNSGPAGVDYSPDGSLLATANNLSGTLSVFTVGAGGVLTLGPNSPFPTGGAPRGVAFHPSGRIIAVATYTGNQVSTFTVAPDGTVAAADTEAVAGIPIPVAFSPDGKYLAAGADVTGNLYLWAVDAAGNLTLVPGYPISTGGTTASSLAWTPNSAFLAVGDHGANVVRVYAIAGNGTPTPVGTYATPPGPVAVAINPTGTILATANGHTTADNTVSTFAMAPDGTLSNRQDFTRGRPRAVEFSPDGTRLAIAGNTGLLYVENVSPTGVLTPVSASPYATFEGFMYDATWSPDGTYIATANHTDSTVSVFGPYTPPATSCTAEQTRASERFWTFGNRGGIDFGTTGTTATPFLLPGAFNAAEGSTTVSDTAGNLLFYSDGATVYDRNGNVMPNGSGLLGSPSAVQTVAAFPAIGRPGVYFVVTTTTNYVNNAFGTLHYSEVDMSLNGGLGAVTAVKNVQLGATNTASESLAAIPNSDNTGFWVLTQQANAANLLAYEFDSTGPTTGTPVVTPLSAGGGLGRTINVSPDLSQIVMNSSGRIRVLDFDGLTGIANERFSWDDPAPGGVGYAADFSPSGDYVYTSKINSGPHLSRFLIEGQPDSAAVLASWQDLGVIGGFGGQVRRGPDGRMYVARNTLASLAVVNTPDTVAAPALTSFALAPGSVSSYGLPQTATGCALTIVALPKARAAVVAESVKWSLGDALPGASTIDFEYGLRPLVPLMGDWDGNGTITVGYFRNPNGRAGVAGDATFYLNNQNDSSAADITFPFFGDPRGYAVAGDFDGNGFDDVAVFRCGLWEIQYLDANGPIAGAAGQTSFRLAAPFSQACTWPAGVPVAGDWDGDGIDGIGTYDHATGTWVLKNTVGAGGPDIGPFVFWGGPGSYPVVGDFGGIGIDTPGYRVGTTWTARTQAVTSGATITFDFGVANSIPFTW